MLRIAFQKKVDGKWVNTELAHGLEGMFSTIQQKLRENVLANQKPILNVFNKMVGLHQEWTIEEIESAYEDAVRVFMEEFKGETVSLA